MLIRETLPLVRAAGYPGVIIFGDSDYYPKHGFRANDHFGITTVDGRNFPAFMGCEALDNGFAEIHGKFYESEAFEHILQADVEEFDREFPPMERRYFPCQW